MLVDGWRDLLWFDRLLHEAAQEPFQSLWFLVGNASGALHQVKMRANDAPFWVAAGPEPPHSPDLNSVLASGASLAGALTAIWNPVGAALVAFGELGRQVLRRRPSTKPDDIFDILDELVASAEKQRYGLVLLVDPLVGMDEHWAELLIQITARHQRLRRRRLIVVVALSDAPPEPGAVNASHSTIVRTAADLTTNGLANWLAIPALDAPTVATVTGASSPVAQALVTQCGGDDALGRRLWNSWVTSKVIARDHSRRWCWTGEPPDPSSAVARILARRYGSDLAATTAATQALCYAALMPSQFCGEAVGRAVAGEGGASEWEVVEDIFDDLAEEDKVAPLLQVQGRDRSVGEDEKILWRYAFRSSDVQKVFGLLDLTERQAASQALLSEHLALYPSGGPCDGDLGRLARLVGDTSLAIEIQRRLAAHARRLNAVLDAEVLLRSIDDLLPDTLLCHQCWTLAQELMRQKERQLAIRVAAAAVDVGRSCNPINDHELSHALYEHGKALGLLMPDIALSELSEAAGRLRALRVRDRTQEYRRDLGVCLLTISVLSNELRRPEAAKAAARRALVALRACTPGDERSLNISAALAELGWAHGLGGDVMRAVDRVACAIRLLAASPRGLRSDAAPLLLKLAQLRLLGQAEYAEAERILRYAEDLLRLGAEDGSDEPAKGEVMFAVLFELGLALMSQQRPREARVKLSEGLGLARVLYSQRPSDASARQTLIQGLTRLGLCEEQDGDALTARKYYEEVRTRVSQIPPLERLPEEVGDEQLVVSRLQSLD